MVHTIYPKMFTTYPTALKTYTMGLTTYPTMLKTYPTMLKTNTTMLTAYPKYRWERWMSRWICPMRRLNGWTRRRTGAA